MPRAALAHPAPARPEAGRGGAPAQARVWPSDAGPYR
jgi:hypothetical protein